MIQIGNSGTMANVFTGMVYANQHLRKPVIQTMRSGKSVGHGTGCSSILSIQVNKAATSSTTVDIYFWENNMGFVADDVRNFSQLQTTTYVQNPIDQGLYGIPYNISNAKMAVLMELVGMETVARPGVYFVGFYNGPYDHLNPTSRLIYGIEFECNASSLIGIQLFSKDVITANGMSHIDFTARKELQMITTNATSVGYETNNEGYICGFVLSDNNGDPKRVLTVLFHANDDADDTYNIHIGTLDNILIPGTSNKFTAATLAENMYNFWDNLKTVAEYDVDSIDLSGLQSQINDIDDDIASINDDIDDINDAINAIPDQIEEAVDEATSSILATQGQLYVSR